MTTRQFNESVNADIRQITAVQVCSAGDWPEHLPESFEEWLKSNSDTIDMPLDRTESACQWFDEQGKIPF